MKISWKTCLRVGVSAFALYLCIHFFPAIARFLGSVLGAATPLIIGGAIAYLLNILMTFYERHYFPKSQKAFVIKSRRPLCMTAAILTLVAIVSLVVGLVVPELVSCVSLLISKLPGFITFLIDKAEELHALPEDIITALEAVDWNSRIEQLFGVLTSGIGNVVNIIINTVFSVFSGIVTAFLSIIFSIYLLASKDSLKSQMTRVSRRYMRGSIYEKVTYFLRVLNDSFHRYIVGQCTEAVILGALCTLGMLILRLPYATMIGALIAFTALIPIAGAYIGAFVGAFMIFTVSPLKALVFLIFIVVLQQLEGNLIYPRVVGSSIGLPAFWVLTAVTLGGGVLGVSGMLLGVPIAATLYRIIKADVAKAEKAKTEEKQATEN